MEITRRAFLKHCVACSAAVGLTPLGLKQLEAALASDGAPTIIWLHGSGCQGDSISFLNRIDAASPPGQRTVDDILVNSINLAYHTVVMSALGETAVTMAKQAQRKGGYILALEGGVPRAFGGLPCQIWSHNGQTMTYEQAVQELAADAAAVVCIGTCAAYGGIPASGNNPTDAVGIREVLDKNVINVPGCPAHPNWIAWTIVQLILGNTIQLDIHDRPTALYGSNIHDNCPRLNNDKATTFGQDHRCLQDLGCRGPTTYADCWNRRWNNGNNWCVDCNGMCFGCVEPTFPGGGFYS
jgi:hydrogenase small subunit